MDKILRYAAIMVLLVVMAAPAMAADIAQGKCVVYDDSKHLVTIEDYDLNINKETPYGRPTGKQTTYNTASAMVGVNPVAGDVLRISYNMKGDERIATKVMNVSKTDLFKK
jgi:hypothetical protein